MAKKAKKGSSKGQPFGGKKAPPFGKTDKMPMDQSKMKGKGKNC